MVSREELLSARVLAIVRMADEKSGLDVAKRIIGAGIRSIEITMTNPGALTIIEKLSGEDSTLLIGVGTILTVKDVVQAKDAGATFIVSPNSDEEVISQSKAMGMLSLPGVASASEVANALRYGADILKLFPAATYGPAHLKALSDPFPGNFWCPTGGVRAQSVAEWFSAGASIVGVGGALLKGGVAAIEGNVRALLDEVAKAGKI